MAKKVLILGGTGMLGHILLRQLSTKPDLDVYATVRSLRGLPENYVSRYKAKIRSDVDADNFDTVIRALASTQPDIVINCIGLIKQIPLAHDPLTAITVNAQLPHRISLVCRAAGAKMIHISTDCIFDGKKGLYKEDEIATPEDLYGRTKQLGEVNYPHCITLRTSIIGHELKGRHGLVEWFLSNDDKVRGYTRAVFSGLPTIELSRIISDYVLHNNELSGTYNVSTAPVAKFDLLKLITARYKKEIEIEPYEDFFIDRSLDSSLFQSMTGYAPPSWEALVERMHEDYIEHKDDYNVTL